MSLTVIVAKLKSLTVYRRCVRLIGWIEPDQRRCDNERPLFAGWTCSAQCYVQTIAELDTVRPTTEERNESYRETVRNVQLDVYVLL